MQKLIFASVCCVAAVDAKGFLSGRDLIQKEELENALMKGFTGSTSNKQLQTIRDELRPMYETLPKNALGRLEPSSVRYALHRYFVHKHGWYVKGLDPQGGSWNSTSQTLTKAWAPAYIQQVFEKRFHSRGLDLEELATFASTLSDLVFGEGISALESIYDILDYPRDRPILAKQFELVIRGYMATRIVENVEIMSRQDIFLLEREAEIMDPSYPDIVMWLRDTRKIREWQRAAVNPFLPLGVSFEFAVELMKDVLHNFGSLSKLECTTIKGNLVDLEEADNGRVKLGTFYASSKIQLRESVDYLRNQGVLEEGKGAPRIIIPNYIMSPCRCLPFSSYFSVCCHNECEDLMGAVEKAIGAPSSTPQGLVGVISQLPSFTVAAPRNLSEGLVGRLQDIANLHHGRVPLHGRLFGQWMHHAFPRECPYPHVSGTVKPVSQVEWLEMYDVNNVLVSEEEANQHIASVENDSDAYVDALPWTPVEELVAGHGYSSTNPRSWVRLLMGVMLCVSFVVPLVRASSKVAASGSSSSSPSKTQAQLV